MESRCELLTLAHAPVDDADHLAAPFTLRGQAYLPARIVRGLEDHDRVAALACHACSLKTSGTGSHDNNFLAQVRLLDTMRHGQFAAGCGIVNAIGRSALIDAIHGGAGAGPGAYSTGR